MQMDPISLPISNVSETATSWLAPHRTEPPSISASSTWAAFECAARLASTVTGARRVSLLLLSGEEQVWVGAAEGSTLQVGQTLLLGRGIASEVVRTRIPMIVQDLKQVALPSHPERGYATPSCMVAPVLWCETLYGVVCAADPRGDGAFSPDHLATLQLLADHLGACLHSLAHASTAANTDPLTGLLTRRAFDEALGTEVERARRFGRPVSLLLLDIDDLRRLNETEGRLVGNRALQRIARALVETVRRIDVVGRYGGDQFSILLAETGREESLKVARRVAFNLRELPMAGRQRTLPLMGANLGVATLPPAAGTGELAERALHAMRLARGEREGLRHWDQDSVSQEDTRFSCVCRLCGKTFAVNRAVEQRERRFCSTVCTAAARRRAKQERNAAILALREEGQTLQAIARRYGISEERVRQICDSRRASSLPTAGSREGSPR